MITANARCEHHLHRCVDIVSGYEVSDRVDFSGQLGLIVPVAAQAPVTLDRSIRDYQLPSEIP